MTVRFGVVGSGYWAEQVHLAVLRQYPGVQLIGVWGRDPAKAEATAGSVGTRPFIDLDAMLAEVDAVSFAVPPVVQGALAPRAARAGVHLLLEKPLALQPAAAKQVVEAVERAGVAALVYFTRRYMPEIEQALPALAAQGPWQDVQARFQSGAMLPGTAFEGSTWRQDKGALWDIGPHALSVLLPILGPVAEALATQDGHVTTLSLRHAAGARSATRLSLHSGPDEAGESYRFTAGAHTTTYNPPPTPRLPPYAAAVGELLAAIAAPSRPPHRCGVRFGLEVVQILAAAEQGLRTGAWQPVP